MVRKVPKLCHTGHHDVMRCAALRCASSHHNLLQVTNTIPTYSHE
jgi:hypothetical protein